MLSNWDQGRLENVLNMYEAMNWNSPMPAVGLMYHEIVRLRREEKQFKHRLLCLEIAANEVQAALSYELNKTLWQKLKGLFA